MPKRKTYRDYLNLPEGKRGRIFLRVPEVNGFFQITPFEEGGKIIYQFRKYVGMAGGHVASGADYILDAPPKLGNYEIAELGEVPQELRG